MPYEGLSDMQVIIRVLNNPSVRPPITDGSKLAPDDEFWAVIHRCWEQIPASRSTAATVGQMVSHQLQDLNG